MQYSNVLSITTGEQAQKNPDQTLLTNEKALTLITNERNPVDSLYFLVPKINPSENLTTWKLALFLINLKTDIVIEDAALALKTLQSLWIIDAEKTLQSSINLWELHTILDKIQKSSSFEQDILSAVNNVFALITATAYEQLMKLLILQEHLQSEPLSSRNLLLVCLNDKGCSDIPYYRNFMNAVLQDIASHSLSPQTLWIDVSNNSVLTLQEYIRLVFLVLGAREFVQSGASTQDYQLLMSILMQSVSQWEERASQNMIYYDQMRLSLEILESHLFDKVVFITHNHLRTILQIYASVEKRGALFEILGDYLGE